MDVAILKNVLRRRWKKGTRVGGSSQRVREMKHINTAVEENKVRRREFFSRMTEGIQEIGRGVMTMLGK